MAGGRRGRKGKGSTSPPKGKVIKTDQSSSESTSSEEIKKEEIKKEEKTTPQDVHESTSQEMADTSQNMANESQTMATESQDMADESQDLAHESQHLATGSQGLADDSQTLATQSQSLADSSGTSTFKKRTTERKKTAADLEKSLKNRPSVKTMNEEKGLDTDIAPSLAAVQQQLDRKMKADTVSHLLESRPDVKDLKAVGVLSGR